MAAGDDGLGWVGLMLSHGEGSLVDGVADVHAERVALAEVAGIGHGGGVGGAGAAGGDERHEGEGGEGARAMPLDDSECGGQRHNPPPAPSFWEGE